ncbi:MAG TPA: hypothetical protein VGQ51_19310 [Puia sp.]|jgi:hypothetical protein|nr:hypothetical protein [Puia sp.]
MEAPEQRTQSQISLSIELTDGAESIRKLYYAEGRGRILTFKPTKQLLRYTLLFALLSESFYLISLKSDQISLVVLFVLSTLATLTLVMVFLRHAGKYFKWKKSVKAMIKQADSYKKVSLIVNAQGFEARYDETVVIEKWSNFKRATLAPTHIFLFGDNAQNYLFPANAMEPSQYEAITQLARLGMGQSASSRNEQNQPAAEVGETPEIAE